MKKNGYGIKVKETPFHLRTELTKNRHLKVATRSSTQWETPHHTASPNWPRQNNQVDKSPDTIHVCMLVSEISGPFWSIYGKKIATCCNQSGNAPTKCYSTLVTFVSLVCRMSKCWYIVY
jgi:hypothetical protein